MSEGRPKIYRAGLLLIDPSRSMIEYRGQTLRFQYAEENRAGF